MSGPDPRKQKAGWAALDKLFAEAPNIRVIHYSCESFYDRPNGRSPRITSIAVRDLDTAQTQSFSIHQIAEERHVPFDEIEARYLLCHCAGGIAGHFRFGGRTATAPVLIGLVFVVLGIGFGESGYALLKTIPDAVLGGLLLFSGIELALSSKLHEHQGSDLFLVLLVAAIGVALNPAAAFAVGLPIAYAFKRGWIRV